MYGVRCIAKIWGRSINNTEGEKAVITLGFQNQKKIGDEGATITDVRGRNHDQPWMIIGRSTREEYGKQFLAYGGDPKAEISPLLRYFYEAKVDKDVIRSWE